jgi:hypothetical protein
MIAFAESARTCKSGWGGPGWHFAQRLSSKPTSRWKPPDFSRGTRRERCSLNEQADGRALAHAHARSALHLMPHELASHCHNRKWQRDLNLKSAPFEISGADLAIVELDRSLCDGETKTDAARPPLP